MYQRVCVLSTPGVIPNLTFAQTSLYPGAQVSLCQYHALPSLSQRMLAGSWHAEKGLPGGRCVYTFT